MAINQSQTSGQVTPAASSPVPSPDAPTKSYSRVPLVAAMLLAAGWIIAIAVLTIATGNLVTLNRQQLIDAKALVFGQVQQDGSITAVEQDLLPWPFEGPVKVMNLEEAGAKVGHSYLFPLVGYRPSSNEYAVVKSHLPNEAPLVYPDGKSTRKQLKELFDAEQALRPR